MQFKNWAQNDTPIGVAMNDATPMYATDGTTQIGWKVVVKLYATHADALREKDERLDPPLSPVLHCPRK